MKNRLCIFLVFWSLAAGSIVFVQAGYAATNVNACRDLNLTNEVYTLTANVSSADTCFNVLAANVTLDGRGYWINYSQSVTGYAVNDSGGYDNITIKNLNAVQGSSSGSSYAIFFGGAVSGTISNNTITTSGGGSHGIHLQTSSALNNITNNTITTSGGSGINMDTNSDSNNAANNIITASGSGNGVYAVTNTNTFTNNTIASLGAGYGVYLDSASSNNFIGGSITAPQSAAYYLRYVSQSGATNNFTSTNFTAMRNITFAEATSWFNYRNDSANNVWLKTGVSAASSVNRTLVTWSQSTMKWNDTNGSVGLTARYNLTGLYPGTNYSVTNTTSQGSTSQIIQTDASGILPSFTISLSGNTEIIVADASPPTFSLNSTNTTAAGTQIKHSLLWADSSALSGYIFSFDNGTGVFANDTWAAFGATGWANVTKGVNSTVGSAIRWQVFANDSSNNWNQSAIYSYATTSTDVPTWGTNIVTNGGFEAGTTGWDLYTNGTATFSINNTDVWDGVNASKVAVSNAGTNTQLYQYQIALSAGKRYNLSFAAYSENGVDVNVRILQMDSPYTTYLSYDPNLTTSWNTYSAQWDQPTNQANIRLMVWFVTYGAGNFHFDNFSISKDDYAPAYSMNSTNSTAAGTDISHRLYWNDNVNLSSYKVLFDNGTGVFVNDTPVAFLGQGNWSNFTKTINSTVGSAIRWRVQTNDTSGNINLSETFSYVTTAAPDTTPPQWGANATSPNSPQTYNPNNNYSFAINWTDAGVNFANATFQLGSPSGFLANYTDNTTGLVGYWRLNAVNSTNYTKDFSGYGNDGQLKNYAQCGSGASTCNLTAGQIGNGLQFDGADDYIDVTNFNKSKYSFSFWILPQNKSCQSGLCGIIVEDGCSSSKDFSIYQKDNTTISISLAFNDTNEYSMPAFFNFFSIGMWQYVGITYNDTHMNLYKNGIFVSSAAISSSISTHSNNKMRIGYAWCFTDRYFNGTIDEVRIYNRSLSAAEIAQQYQMQYPYYAGTDDSLNGTWAINFTQAAIGGAGSYNYTWFGTDSVGNKNSTQTVGYAINTAPLSLIVQPQTQSITYGTSVTQYCSNNITAVSCLLYRNSSSITNNTAIILGAGTYNYTANITDTQNYTVWQNSSLLTVSKAIPAITMSNTTNSVNTSGLVFYMPFSEGSGASVTEDKSGWGNNGTLTNMNTTGNATSGWTSGKYGSGLQFDGVDDYVVSRNDTSINNPYTNGYTLDAWVNKNAVGGTIVQFNRYSFQISFSGDNAQVYAWGCGVVAINSLAPLANNQWYHITATWGANDKIRLYINGILQGEGNSCANLNNGGGIYLPVYIGSDLWGWNFFNGSIDEVRIYNRSLSAQEIKQLYNSSKYYPYASNVSASINNAEQTLSLYRYENASISGLNDTIQLAAGSYWYIANASSSQNYTRIEALLPFEILQNNTNPIKLWISNTSARFLNQNISGIYPTISNTTAVSGYVQSGTLNLFYNDLLNNSLNNTNMTLAAGTYKITANTSGNGNYTGNATAYYIIIGKGTPSLNILIDSLPSDKTISYPNTAVVRTNESNAGDSDLTYGFYRMGSYLLGTGSDLTNNEPYGNSTWTFSYNTTGGQNYTSGSATDRMLKVLKGDASSYLEIYLDGAAANRTITYPSIANVTANWSSFGAADMSFGLYRDGALIGSGNPASEYQRLGNGTLIYTYNTSGGANWTLGSAMRALFVNKGLPDARVFIDGDAKNKTVPYPVTTGIKGNSTTAINPPSFSLYISNRSASGNPASISGIFDIGENQIVYNTSGNANWSSAANNTIYLTVSAAAAACITNSASSCVSGQYAFSGFVFSGEGGLAGNGTVMVKVKETGDTFTSTFSNGYFSISPSFCLVPGRVYNFALQTESAGKKAAMNFVRAASMPAQSMACTATSAGCAFKTYPISGRALDSKTGSPIQNGTVKVTVVETGDTYSEAFGGGNFSISPQLCLTPNKAYSFLLTVEGGGMNGIISYNAAGQ